MTKQSFSLCPFPDPIAPNIRITGEITRNESLLSVQYLVTGPIDSILLPGTSKRTSRKGELWKATCFEFFLAIPEQPQYWEFNMSPSGDWNIYRMNAYRRVGFREETSIQQLELKIQKDADRLSIISSVDLDPIIKEDTRLLTGITSVIQTLDGHETYWALAHPEPRADFHLRDSFIIQV